ncbi:MAG TPA: MBL fold metallo-hydrolase [Vulgatibacter sp.]
MASIQFLGAAGTVTGSAFLVEHEGRRILLDCGLFQGEKEWRRRNWDPFPIPPSWLDAVILSHAHIDHSGGLPRLVRQGFRGPIYTTPATRDLLAIMLPDSGRLHEEEAADANRLRWSKHAPALPLYSEEDALRCLGRIETARYGVPTHLPGGIDFTFHRAGHILGSAIVQVDLSRDDGFRHTLVFSGDLGRFDMPIVRDPEPIARATTLLLECTYGDQLHESPDPREELGRIVRDVVERRGVLLIPSFAIGRTQDLLFHLRQLQLAGAIPTLPIFVDSPMACDATPLYLLHREEHDAEMNRMLSTGQDPLTPRRVEFTRSTAESKAIADARPPLIVISAAGMATGGRVLHHLSRWLPDPNATVLFVGYQAGGSRGRRIVDGSRDVRIHGRDVPIRARILQLRGFSAHADRDEVDRWLSSFGTPPARTFCVHGEGPGLEATRSRLEARGWSAYVPSYMEKVELE